MSSCRHCQIAELNGHFARALDLADVDAWVGTFTPNAHYDNGRARLQGHAALRTWITRRAVSVPPRTTRHVWSGLVIEPAAGRALTGDLDLDVDVDVDVDVDADGDVVRVTSTWVCYAANEPPPVDRVGVWSVADFVDTCVRVDDRWLLASRTIRTVFRDPSLAPPA
jgi:hypothetical protein